MTGDARRDSLIRMIGIILFFFLICSIGWSVAVVMHELDATDGQHSFQLTLMVLVQSIAAYKAVRYVTNPNCLDRLPRYLRVPMLGRMLCLCFLYVFFVLLVLGIGQPEELLFALVILVTYV